MQRPCALLERQRKTFSHPNFHSPTVVPLPPANIPALHCPFPVDSLRRAQLGLTHSPCRCGLESRRLMAKQPVACCLYRRFLGFDIFLPMPVGSVCNVVPMDVMPSTIAVRTAGFAAAIDLTKPFGFMKTIRSRRSRLLPDHRVTHLPWQPLCPHRLTLCSPEHQRCECEQANTCFHLVRLPLSCFRPQQMHLNQMPGPHRWSLLFPLLHLLY